MRQLVVEPIAILFRLAALIPQMALHPLIRALFPRLDGSAIMNATSPMRDARFRQYLCDRALANAANRGAEIYDIGGTGQVSPAMDAHGRIREARDVNPNSPCPDRLTDISQIAEESADLVIMCRTVQCLGQADLQALLSNLLRALRRSGCLVVCGPEFSASPSVDRLVRSLYSRTSPILAGVVQNFRSGRETAFDIERAGFDVQVDYYVNRLGAGRSFVLFARPR